jgi:D-alanyl-D-alanine carboxypeptidase
MPRIGSKMDNIGAWVDYRENLPYRGMAAGGGCSTVGDLFIFTQALERGKLLHPELRTMRPSRKTTAVGMGTDLWSQAMGRCTSMATKAARPE